MRRGEPFPRDPRPSGVDAAEALLITMAGLLAAGRSRPLHADAVVPAMVTVAAKPKSVQVSPAVIGSEPAGSGPIPLDKGQIFIKGSGEEKRPVFVQTSATR